ncbi:hypothetical protein [Cupriavidus sp. RAF20_2]|uniref:hypothetical protein n=1 Tax=Cupriavidus sp. RAF20_2 TaxID=3233053 RepID=UPI003F91E304
MAVDFSLLPESTSAKVRPPSRLLWSVLFIGMLLLGVAVVLLCWPADLPTSTPAFWISVIGFPIGVPAWIVLRRFSAYEGKQLDASLHNEVVQAYNTQVFQAASVPLRILGAATRFSSYPEEQDLARVRSGALRLAVQAPIADTGEPVKARWLVTPGMRTSAGRAEDDRRRRREVTAWLFDELLAEISDKIQSLPMQLDIAVRLHIANQFTPRENEALWQERWHAKPLRATQTPVSDAPPSLMFLDQWMDAALEGEADCAILLVSVQLHGLLADTPPAGTAEAGVALLLVPESHASKHRLSGVAALHRPVRGRFSDAREAISRALMWGGLSGDRTVGGWQTGVSASEAGRLREASLALGMHGRPVEIDQTIGDARAAAPWLAIACAALSMGGNGQCPVIFVGEPDRFDCAILKPIDR